MEHADIKRLIDIISWGKTIVSTPSASFVLRQPTPEEKARASLIYTNALTKAIQCGMLTEEDTLNSLVEFGQWNIKKQEAIDGIQKDIHTIRKGLLDFLFNKNKLEKARKLLRNAEKVLTVRLIERQELVSTSAETQALLEYQRYLIGLVTETKNGDSYWPSSREFDEESNTELIQNLCKTFFYQSVPTNVIRLVARSGAWRAVWNSSKHFGNIFNSDISVWSDLQHELIHWSLAYDGVYEAFERPSEDIIEDDDLLDSWFIRQHDKIIAKTNKADVEKQIAGHQPKKGGRNEQFIMADSHSAKKIYDMNDPMSRAKIKARQKVLKEKGAVKEQHMPDSKRDIQEQLVEMQRKHVKNIGSR